MSVSSTALLSLTRDQAQEHARNLQAVQALLVAQIQAVARKRSWTPAQKTHAKTELQRRLHSVTSLCEMFCAYYGISGH